MSAKIEGVNAKLDSSADRQRSVLAKIDTMQADITDVKGRVATIEGWIEGRRDTVREHASGDS